MVTWRSLTKLCRGTAGPSGGWRGLLFVGGLVVLMGCSSDPDPAQEEGDSPASPTPEQLKSGEALAKTHCGSCHLYPEPDLLDRTSWREHVLPSMGYMMGIYPDGERPDSLFESGRAGTRVREAGVYPKEPQLSRAQWERIVRFYTENAPEAPLPQDNPPEIELGLDQFDVRFPDFRLEPPLTSLVHIDTARSRIFVGDHKDDVATLNILDRKGERRHTLAVGTAPSSLHMRQDVPFVATMGEFMPSDRANGRLVRLLQRKQESGYDSYYTILDSLQRPAHFAVGDLTGNGMTDVVVGEFGYHTGQLAWFENRGGGQFAEHVLMPKPGAVRTYVHDFNDDGRPDIIALMGQGNEGIDIYYNRGGGRFERERVLRFHPAYGSSYFELVDFNRDGHLDILYTNGDNGDFYPTLKRYHGVRIFINDGTNAFEERYFFPLNGAYRAKAEDFELDGDLDLFVANGPLEHEMEGDTAAVLKNYAIYDQEPLLYLNQGNGRFREVDTRPGGLLSSPMAARGAAHADVDGDGDLDLIVTEADGPVHLWENRTRRGHFLRVHLEGTVSNRDGIGARIVADVGGRSLRRTVRSGSSYLSQSERVVTFGLGERERVDTLRVRWPSGAVDERVGVEADQEIHVRESVRDVADSRSRARSLEGEDRRSPR